ncbi:alpha/beta hydrolase [Brevibacillus fulvus]|nr:alpha/beta hydrolase [Brevibacillus fulvus]
MELIVLFVGGMMLLSVLVAAVLSLVVGWKLTHPPRKPVAVRPEQYGIDVYEEIAFPSRQDGLLLRGWYFSAKANGQSDSGYTLIFAHGYSQNRLEPHLPALSLAKELLGSGYDVLMFDFRNAGMSEGNVTTIGLFEQNDLLGAVDYVKQRFAERGIGLIGFSMGAATALLAAAREPRINAVIADSPFYSLPAYLRENLSVWTGLPRFPFNWLIMKLIPWLMRIDPEAVNPWQAVQRLVSCPVLFIHGRADTTIPWENSKNLYELSDKRTAELWLVPASGHVRSYASQPKRYVQTVQAFLKRKLPPVR